MRVSNTESVHKGKGSCGLGLPFIKVKSFTLLYTGLKRAAQCSSAWGMDLDTGGWRNGVAMSCFRNDFESCAESTKL